MDAIAIALLMLAALVVVALSAIAESRDAVGLSEPDRSSGR